jgi:hypothetical protein
LIAEHSVREQCKIDRAELRGGHCQHLRMVLSVIEIRDDHVHAQGAAYQQVLGHRGQLLFGSGYKEEVDRGRDELAHDRHGDCGGSAEDEYPLRGIDRPASHFHRQFRTGARLFAWLFRQEEPHIADSGWNRVAVKMA